MSNICQDANHWAKPGEKWPETCAPAHARCVQPEILLLCPSLQTKGGCPVSTLVISISSNSVDCCFGLSFQPMTCADSCTLKFVSISAESLGVNQFRFFAVFFSFSIFTCALTLSCRHSTQTSKFTSYFFLLLCLLLFSMMVRIIIQMLAHKKSPFVHTCFFSFQLFPDVLIKLLFLHLTRTVN